MQIFKELADEVVYTRWLASKQASETSEKRTKRGAPKQSGEARKKKKTEKMVNGEEGTGGPKKDTNGEVHSLGLAAKEDEPMDLDPDLEKGQGGADLSPICAASAGVAADANNLEAAEDSSGARARSTAVSGDKGIKHDVVVAHTPATATKVVEGKAGGALPTLSLEAVSRKMGPFSGKQSLISQFCKTKGSER